jgi:hypothetical protein
MGELMIRVDRTDSPRDSDTQAPDLDVRPLPAPSRRLYHTQRGTHSHWGTEGDHSHG